MLGGGGFPDHRSSASRSADTTRFAESRSLASSARSRNPPRSSFSPLSSTSTGPSMRNSTVGPALSEQAGFAHRKQLRAAREEQNANTALHPVAGGSREHRPAGGVPRPAV